MESTTFLEKVSSVMVGPIYILPAPMKQPESLGEYTLRWMREKKLTAVQIEATAKLEAARRGLEETHKISDSAVNNILNDQSANQRINTLMALAWGIGRPIEEVINVAVGLEAATQNKQFMKSRFARLYEIYSNLASTEDEKYFTRQLDAIERDMQAATKSKK